MVERFRSFSNGKEMKKQREGGDRRGQGDEKVD